MSGYPADIVNESLLAIGADFVIGDLEEGTIPAQMALRKYTQCLRQLLRAVHWDFARLQQPLDMLADATGQTAGVGTVVPAPWVYEYSYPINCMKARFLPANYLNPNAVPPGNITTPVTVPQTSVPTQAPYGFGMRLIPAPFLVGMDTNYPVAPDSNWMETQGSSPAGRVVILTNINQAQLVYTGFTPFPSNWDSQFRAAFVAYLAAELTMGVLKDKKFAMELRRDQMAVAKNAVRQARITNGNEASSPQTIDRIADFTAFRQVSGVGGNGYGWNQGMGCWGMGGLGWNGFGYLGYGCDQSVF